MKKIEDSLINLEGAYKELKLKADELDLIYYKE